MHETAIMCSALEIILNQAQENRLSKITKVTLHIGELSGVVPEALEFVFESVSSGTLAEGAELILERIKGSAVCGDCGQTFEIDHFNKLCPDCQTFSDHFLTGFELTIHTIEGENNE